MISFCKPRFYDVIRMLKSASLISIGTLLLLTSSCSQQKFAFRNKIAVPKKTEETVEVTKEKVAPIQEEATLMSANAETATATATKQKKQPKKQRKILASVDTLLTAAIGKAPLVPFHYKQLSPEETPPKPLGKYREESGLENAGLYSFLAGLLTYLFIYYLIAATPAAAIILFFLSLIAAIAAIVFGVMAINQREGVGLGVLGLILGGAWVFIVALIIALILALA
jgi:hypothetical protein